MWPKTALLPAVWPRDAKTLDTPGLEFDSCAVFPFSYLSCAAEQAVGRHAGCVHTRATDQSRGCTGCSLRSVSFPRLITVSALRDHSRELPSSLHRDRCRRSDVLIICPRSQSWAENELPLSNVIVEEG